MDGFTLHAHVRVAARDRGRLERLCRYLFRPPIADARLARAGPDRIELELKTPYSDGTTHLVLDPMTLLERLAALVPPPRAHLVVYHGVLASASTLRASVIPTASLGEDGCASRPFGSEFVVAAPDGTPARPPPPCSRNYSWAELMKRVFLVDVLQCPCGGSRRILASITDSDTIARILRSLGLTDVHPARGPPSPPLDPPPDPGVPPVEVRLVLE